MHGLAAGRHRPRMDAENAQNAAAVVSFVAFPRETQRTHENTQEPKHEGLYNMHLCACPHSSCPDQTHMTTRRPRRRRERPGEAAVRPGHHGIQTRG